MTDSQSIKMKPAAAMFMALAMITTTFAGVSYADPSDNSWSDDTTSVTMDYANNSLNVYYSNANESENLTVDILIYESDYSTNFNVSYGPITMVPDSYYYPYTDYAWQNMTMFFEGNETLGPMAAQGIWYSVEITVKGDYGGYPHEAGEAYLEICMWNGSVCDDEIEEPSITDASVDFYDGMLEVIVYDQGDFGYAYISVMDMQFNELFNATFNSTVWNYNMTASNYTEAQYLVMVSLTDTDGMNIFTMMETVGDYDEDQMMFDYYDNDSNGLIEWEEFLNTLQQANQDMGVEPMENESIAMLSSIFMSEDADGDGALDFDEFMSFMETLDGDDNTVIYDGCLISSDPNDSYYECWMEEWLDEDGEIVMSDGYDMDECEELPDSTWKCERYDNDNGDDFEMLMMMLDTNGDGNLTLTEILAIADGMETMYTNVFNHNDFNGDGMLSMDEFQYFIDHMDELDSEICAYVKTGDTLMEDGWLMDEDDFEIEVMAGDTADFDGEYCYQGPMSAELMIFMMDTDGDGELDITEIMAMFNQDGEMDEMGMQMTQWVFEQADQDQSSGLSDEEMQEFLSIMDSDEEFQPSPSQIMTMWDADADGSVSLTEVISYLNSMNSENGEEPLSAVQEEWTGVAFMMSDSDGNELLDEEEFTRFYYQLSDDGHDDDHSDDHGDHGDGMEQFICYDMANHTVMMQFDNENDCVDAGYMWANMNDRPGHDGGDDDREDGNEGGLEIQFESNDVWFEQWNDETMELVIVQLAVIDNPEEIALLVAMADAEYGNDNSMLDEREVEMLKGLYALSLDPEEMAEGLSLDGANGTTVDFWVDVDGLIEGEDVVFIRVGFVIEFPTSAYDSSTSHTFIVDNSDDGPRGICHDMSTHTDTDHDNQADCEAAGLMWMGDTNDENECNSEEMIWIHNSETWNLDSTTGFTFEETNNAWYANNCDLDAYDSLTFTLVKVENATLPTPEDDDWTWEDEDMNMFPVCAWKYSANFADNTSVTEAWMEQAPESGDYELVLVDDAAYEIFVSCWDPEGGKMVVDITSAVGNSSNTSIGEAMGHVAFKLPAGTSGNVTFDVTWTDGHHTESGTLTVYATGDGDIDLSEIDVEDASGVLPGFTAGLGVLAMLGAAMLAGRRNNA